MPKNYTLLKFNNLIKNVLSVFKLKVNTKSFFLVMTIFCGLINAFGQTITDNTPGGIKIITIPAGVTSLTVELWGGGGGGQGAAANPSAGAGGSGSGYIKTTYVVSSGTTYNYFVGTGGTGAQTGSDGTASWFVDNATFLAVGGSGGGTGLTVGSTNGTAPNAPNAGNIGGIINTYGGKGADGGYATPFSGGGGSSGGNVAGNNASNSTGGVAPANGYAGADGRTSPNNGQVGKIGAGGSGGLMTNATVRTGGNGGNGQARFTYISVTGITPNPVCVGSTITITGTNFGNGTSTVSINGISCTSVTRVSATSITAVVAAGTTAGTVAVTNPSGSNNGQSISVNPLPAVTNVATASTCSGTGPNIILTSDIPSGFSWAVGAVTGSITGANPGNGTSINDVLANPSSSAAGTVKYLITPTSTDSGCAGKAFTITVTVKPTPAIVVTPFPVDRAPGVCGSGGGAINGISWAASASATSYDVYFGAGSVPTTVTANVATNSYTTGSLALNTTYYWRVVAKNACGDASPSSTFTFTTSNVPCYCLPTTATPATFFIKNVRFLGTLNDVSNDNNGFGNGFQDFTGSANKTSQVAGEGINIFVESNGADTLFNAWVDWNKDGFFDNTSPVTTTSELVFTSNGTRAISTTFGIVIPAGTVPGDYRIRIRNYSTGSANYDTCAPFTGVNGGEAEDYTIKVLSSCASNIITVTDTVNCGPGALTISAKGNSGTTLLKWYDAEFGGNLLATTAVDASLNASYITPSISSTTTYYVTALGTCESIFRTPVVARIKPLPNVSFDLPSGSPSFCGDDNTLNLTSVGGNETVDLFNEKFDSGLGIFAVSNSAKNNSVIVDTQWQNQPSTFKPKGAIWSPAISSGFGGNKFVYATSDYSTRTVETLLTTTTSYNTSNFVNLTLTFSAYYSFYGDTSSSAGGTVEGLFIEVSKDNGSTWTNLQTYNNTLGFGTRFDNFSVILNNTYIGIANLKIRFRYLAYWGDGLAIDNIKLSGDRPLVTSFVWTAPNIGIYASDCITPYINGTAIDKVCLKPSATQLQTIQSWNILAQATLSNGCTADGNVVIQNNNKYWDQTISNWNTTNWQPNATLPDITKCVIIKQPVVLDTGSDGSAKSVSVEIGGSLTIKAPRTLTINDYLRNNTTADKVVLESDGNLIQNSNAAINVGDITAKKNIALRADRQQYNYLISPLIGQSLSSVYPNIDRVLYYRESNNYFYTSSGVYVPGRGLAVKVANTATPTTTASVPAIFKGVPANGVITYPLAFTNSTDYGYNLVGNPYPSNINLDLLYNFGTNSAAIQPNFYFWDNLQNLIYQQQGTLYSGISYAMFNAVAGSNGTGIKAPNSADKVPGNNVKVGQGFIVRAREASKSLTFDNLIRTSNQSGSNFYGRAAGSNSNNSKPDDRFWLEILTPNQITNSSAVVYFDGGKDALADDDTKMFEDTSDGIYTVVEGERVAIQGKATFVNTDILSLSTSQFTDGLTTIKLTDREGVFATGQNIYLKDKATGMVTNLTDTSYTFQSVAGSTDGRFEIMYQPEATLSTGNVIRENLWIYREANDFVVKAGQKMKEVSLYDASGRLIFTVRPLSKEIKIAADKLLNGVFVLKINLSDGEIVTRKIRK